MSERAGAAPSAAPAPSPRPRWRIAILLLAALGCASAEVHRLPATDRTSAARVAGVPFFAQDDKQCGPASLAMVLAFGGAALTPRDLTGIAYTPGREGALQIDLVSAARRRGRIPFTLPPRLDALLAELRAGHPVLVFQNLGLTWLPVWHFAVAIGYDGRAETVTLHTGPREAASGSLHRFAHTWARGGHWGRVVLPPGELPATLDATAAIEDIAAFERSAEPGAAVPAYRAAVERWPEASLPRLALGNALYADGRLEAAAETFRALVEREPELGIARNNLAQTLSDLGRFDEAAREIERAIATGGPFAESFARTRDEIERRREPPAARPPQDR